MASGVLPWYEGPVWQGFKWTPTNPRAHSGIDLGMPIGTPLTALLPGRIISAGMEPWGGQVNIAHAWAGVGPIVVSYLHASKLVRTSGDVEPGTLVALSGEPPDPRYGTGAHCHFEVSKGTQPPYMGHVGPCNPIDGTFLLDYAKRTNGGIDHMGIPTGWKDDGSTLVAPNGVQVVLGKREYILTHPWDPKNVPQGLSYHADPASPAHPEWGAGERQEFRDGSLLWLKDQQDRGIFAAETGADYAAVMDQLAAANKTITALRAQLSTTSDPGYVQFRAAIEALAAALKVV